MLLWLILFSGCNKEEKRSKSANLTVEESLSDDDLTGNFNPGRSSTPKITRKVETGTNSEMGSAKKDEIKFEFNRSISPNFINKKDLLPLIESLTLYLPRCEDIESAYYNKDHLSLDDLMRSLVGKLQNDLTKDPNTNMAKGDIKISVSNSEFDSSAKVFKVNLDNGDLLEITLLNLKEEQDGDEGDISEDAGFVYNKDKDYTLEIVHLYDPKTVEDTDDEESDKVEDQNQSFSYYIPSFIYNGANKKFNNKKSKSKDRKVYDKKVVYILKNNLITQNIEDIPNLDKSSFRQKAFSLELGAAKAPTSFDKVVPEVVDYINKKRENPDENLVNTSRFLLVTPAPTNTITFEESRKHFQESIRSEEKEKKKVLNIYETYNFEKRKYSGSYSLTTDYKAGRIEYEFLTTFNYEFENSKIVLVIEKYLKQIGERKLLQKAIYEGNIGKNEKTEQN